MKSRSHRLPTISDTPDDWVDESWTVDCVCGVNFDDGEEMVDCDECGVWVHTRCSRYVKSEKLFSCDKCKNKKLRKESEETEVAQLLVELPTKTLRMENSYPMSCPPQSSFQVWTEIPLEEKVHVQGIPGGDPGLFSGVSSVFSQQLWKCTGYVPKKFNSQYREFPCWDERQDDDDDDDKDKELENPACKGADALFSLSTSGAIKSQVNGGGVLDMGPPTTDTKKQDVRKERSLLKPIVIHSGNQKKDDSKLVKDQNKKKNVKAMDKDGDSKKRSFESVSVMSSDAKQSESYEGKGHKVSKTDKQSLKHENSRTDLQDNHKSDDNIPLSSGQPSGNVAIDDSTHSRLNPLKEAKEMEENNGNQVPMSVEISDGKASSLKQNPMETSTIKDEVNHDVADDANGNGRSCSTSNGTQPNTTNLNKADLTPNVDPQTTPLSPIEVKAVETNLPIKTSNYQNAPTSDSKLDNPKTLSQDTKTSDDRLSPSFEVKKESVSVSHSQIHKVQNLDKTVSHVDTQSEGPPKSHGTTANPSGAPNQRKITGKPSSKPTVPEKPRSSNTDDRGSSGKQKGTSESNNKIKKDNVDVSEKSKKFVKELSKSSSTSALKSSHLSKSSHAPLPKKNSSDSKDPAILSSSKTATTPDSGDSANSLRCESGGANEQNKSTSESSQKGEKISQINRQPAIKNHPSHVHPPPSTNLSDEELALLLHQELNSSPRVPRVPRMRHAGSLPQLASTTPTSTLMKRTSSSGGKDNNGPRKRNKDSTNNGRELDGAKKGDKIPSVPTSRRHELVKNGSTNKSAPPVSTTASSGPSSSNEANEHMLSPQNASDDEVPTHRTLPGLIAEIMSKGKRMAYEELCNAVLPHWPNLRKHNGERYAYSSHSQAVLDCLRNRSEWSRLVDRGPKTNAGRKRRKSEADTQNVESEEEEDDDYSTDRNTKDVDNNKNLGDEFSKGKRKVRKHRRLAMQGTRIKRRRKAEVVSDDDIDSSSDSSEESAFSDEGGRTSVPNEASASSES